MQRMYWLPKIPAVLPSHLMLISLPPSAHTTALFCHKFGRATLRFQLLEAHLDQKELAAMANITVGLSSPENP